MHLGQCLRERKIQEVDCEEVLSEIRDGAQKLFAILVLMQGHPVNLILNFMRRDQMLRTSLDSKLPFRIKDLRLILQDKPLASDFDRWQWEVLSPLFKPDRTHRELMKKTILPFIREELMPDAKGGFSVMSKVTLHQSHHCFDQRELARKQIVVGESNMDMVENERRIMRLLRLLRHESMVQLLASYSVVGSEGAPSHFLLMPLAEMSLIKVLQIPEKGKAPTLRSIFGNDATLLYEIHGLSSALDEMHHYQHNDGTLRLKGCHFDLDPRNILIKGRKLLLADFGLSRLKSESADSCTPFHGGGASHYTAPECLNTEKLEYHGSKSDMWSFGGIIYDLVACMMGGSRMVASFQDSRKHKAAGITSCRFHIGGMDNPKVAEWIEAHKEKMNCDHRALCSVAKQVLVLEPTQRPDSRALAGQLFMIAVLAQFRDLDKALACLAKKNKTLRLQLEQMKLRIWARHAGLGSEKQASRVSEETWLQKFSRSNLPAKDLLQKAKKEVDFLLQNDDLARPGLAIFETLQEIFERLWGLAPHACRSLMTRDAEIEMMNLPDIVLEEKVLASPTEEAVGEDSSNNEIRILQLTAMRKFQRNVTEVETDQDNESSVKLLDEASVKINKSDRKQRSSSSDVREWSLISLKDSTAQCLCEWVKYEPGLMEVGVDPQRLYRRVRSIVRQLSAAKSHPSLRALPCEGYFVRKSESAFGIVFSLPTSKDNLVEPMTLNQTILWTSRPSLTEIFRTARAIAKSIFYFHGVSWVHKNISSYSVVVFDETLRNWVTQAESSNASRRAKKIAEDQPQGDFAKKPGSIWPWSGKPNVPAEAESNQSLNTTHPIESGRQVIRNESLYALERIPEHYIVGFNHSRADDKVTFTSGKSGPWYVYQHYRYAIQSGESFQSGYDYYSLGLVLLELGLWTQLKRLPVLEQEIGQYPLDRLQELLCEKAVPQLKPMVGDEYAEAVRICLSGDLLDVDRTDVEEVFSKEVLARLEDCNV